MDVAIRAGLAHDVTRTDEPIVDSTIYDHGAGLARLMEMEAGMFMVYWTEGSDEAAQATARSFDSGDMSGAMKFMEQLRARQRNGEAIGFVTMASENPQSVGHPGVADPGADYSWKKRRR